MAQDLGVGESPWAWLSAGQCATWTGRPTDAEAACQRALALVRDCDDVTAHVNALHMLGMSLTTSGRLAEAEPLYAEAGRLAEQSGSRMLVGIVAVADSASLCFRREPDFAGSLDVLTRLGDGSCGALVDMWLDTDWAVTLLGLDAPGAAARAVLGARVADRLMSGPALDESLHVLAVVAAEAGFRDEAWALKDHAVASGGTFAAMGEPVAWVLDRLDRALGDRTTPPPSAPMHRRDLMALVDELGVRLAATEPARHERAADGDGDVPVHRPRGVDPVVAGASGGDAGRVGASQRDALDEIATADAD